VESNRLLTLLLDRDRLAVAGALATRPMTTDELVEHTGVRRRTTLVAVGDLRAAALVVDDDGTYRLDDEAMRAAARDARFFSGRVLNEIPSQRAKQLVVLQRLVLEFDPGRRYTEFEVNAVLGAFHPDWSTLRRGLVDEGLMDREPTAGGSLYWRSGGRVTDLPPD
jgi:hypothetical protein